MVTPTTTTLAIVRTTSGATGALANEAMSELDLSAWGYPARSVYQITTAANRYLARSAVPTFEVDDGGGFDPLVPAEIQYAGGVIILSTPLAGAYTVRCATGTAYTTTTNLIGGSVARMTTGPTLVDTPILGDTYARRVPAVTDFSFTLDAFAVNTCAAYTTTGGNVNSHVTYTHTPGGTTGNSYTVNMVDPGLAGQSLSVTVAAKAITINLATDGAKAITSTANQVISAVNNSSGCNYIKVHANKVGAETGAGVVAATGGAKSFTGGLDITDHTLKFGVTLIVEIYFSTTADSRLEGYCYLESLGDTFNPKGVITENLTFKGDGKLYFRPS